MNGDERERADIHVGGQVAKHEAKNFYPWHRQMARMLVGGATFVECAEHFGKSVQTLKSIHDSAIFQGMLREYQNEMDERTFNLQEYAGEHAEEAMKVILDIMRDKENVKPGDRRAAALDVLDRGHGKPVVFSDTTTEVSFDLETAETLAEALRESVDEGEVQVSVDARAVPMAERDVEQDEDYSDGVPTTFVEPTATVDVIENRVTGFKGPGGRAERAESDVSDE